MRGTLPRSCGLKRRMLIFSLRGAGSLFMFQPPSLQHKACVTSSSASPKCGTLPQHFIDPFIPATEALGQQVFVGHQHLLQRETIGTIASLLERFDLGEAPGCVGMIDVIPGAVA